MRFKNLLKPI
jgi:dynein heavy chain